jgi:mono/diheme cytochrome c family protein
MKIKIKKICYVLIATTLVFTVSCGGSSSTESEEHEHSEEMNHDMEGMDQEMEGEDHEHAQGEGHMAHMDDVKDMLKQALGDKYDSPEFPAPTEEQLAQGKQIFSSSCVACHGMTGKGDGAAAAALDPKPADFTDDSHSRYYSDEGRLHIIKNGVQGTGMVGWSSSFSEEELMSVYLYVRSLRSVSTDSGSMAMGKYACPMHPEITSDKEGDKCSKCGMELVASNESDDGHDHTH